MTQTLVIIDVIQACGHCLPLLKAKNGFVVFCFFFIVIVQSTQNIVMRFSTGALLDNHSTNTARWRGPHVVERYVMARLTSIIMIC